MEKQYRKTVSGTIGTGMSSLLGGTSNYYILEHKVSSKFHKAGESQEIIVGYAEIGRDKSCAIRFDESFETVSRHHAAIIKDGDNWELVQLSKTNSTLLNGNTIKNEWYLQNGDEIQLSINGPKLGFIIPNASEKGNSLKLTHRLKLFKEQALRPYRSMLIIIGVILFLIIGGGVGYGIHMNNVNKEAAKKHEQEKQELQRQIIEQNNMLSVQIEQMMELTLRLDSSNRVLNQAKLDAIKATQAANKNEKDLQKMQQQNIELLKNLNDLKTDIDRINEEKRLEEEAKMREIDDYINSQKHKNN